MVAAAISVAEVSLWIALDHKGPADQRPQSELPRLENSAERPTALSGSLGSISPPQTHVAKSDRLQQESGAVHASSVSGTTRNVRPRTVQSEDGIEKSTDSPPDGQAQPNSKPSRPAFWSADISGGYELVTDHDWVHTGSSSAVIESSTPQSDANSQVAVYQACRAGDFQGKRAQFTIYLLGEDGFGSAEVWLRFDDPTNAKEPIGIVRQAAPLASPSDWTVASATIDVPLSARILTYGIILHGPGPLRIDTAQLNVIDADGSTREEPSRDQTANDMLINTGSVPRYPRNMDFETFFTPT